MKQHIAHFPKYLLEGYDIGREIHVDFSLDDFSQVLFVGMGGSGMASSILKEVIERGPRPIPCTVVKEYDIPGWVSSNTLMVVASYSGNTEETITAMKKGLAAGAHMLAVTSGGTLKDFAIKHEHTLAEMPTGIEPRAALPYSFGIQLALFESLGTINESVLESLVRVQDRSMEHHETIHNEAKHIAEQLANTIPVVYTTSKFAPVALRARQQLNENARMLCRDHLLPEHNHNELLGVQEGNKQTTILWYEDPDMYIRNKKRVELTKQVLEERKFTMISCVMEGSSYLQKICSSIYRIDRLSYYTAMKRGVDPSGMELIERLKGELKQFKG